MESQTKEVKLSFLDGPQQGKLAGLLEGCRCMSDKRERDQVIRKLGSDVRSQIQSEGSASIVVPEMVRVCSDYPDNIELLIRAVAAIERNSIPMGHLWDRLPDALGFSDPDIHGTISQVLEFLTAEQVPRKAMEAAFQASISPETRRDQLPAVHLMCRWRLLREAESLFQRPDGTFPFADFIRRLLPGISDKEISKSLACWAAHLTGEPEKSFRKPAKSAKLSAPEKAAEPRDLIHVFISYAREDIATAKRLYQDLKTAGVKPWMDEFDLLVGQNWKATITQTIEKSDFFLALLSSNSLTKRGYVQKELRRAMSVLEEMPTTDIFILPARLEDCKPEDERLRNLNWADLFPDYDAGLTKLIRVLEHQKSHSGADDPTRAKGVDSESGLPGVHEAPMPKYDLRSTPRTVSDDEFEEVFWLDEIKRPLEYVQNDYQDNGDGTVTDRATGLTWQQAGSKRWLKFEEIEKYLGILNRSRFAGFTDWRLPTVDELESLLEPDKKGKLYIDPIFNDEQKWCWSADYRASGGKWNVGFDRGIVDIDRQGGAPYVRAVRP